MASIDTARLRLRPFTLDDLNAYHAAIRSDPDVMRYLPGGLPQSRDVSDRVLRFFIDYWTQHPYGGWAVIHAADGRLIGQAGLQQLSDRPEVELYYAFAKAYWHQGFASEAAHAVLRYGFETAGLDRIIAVFAPENTASEHVMISCGMTAQGLLPCYGTQLPSYAITRAEFQPGTAPYTLHP